MKPTIAYFSKISTSKIEFIFASFLCFILLNGCTMEKAKYTLDEYNQTFDKSAESSGATSLEPGKAYTKEEFEEAAGTDMEFTPLDEYNQVNSSDSKGS